MSRTIKEVKIIGKGIEEVKIYAGDWFHANGFKIRDWDSKGRLFNLRGWFSIIGAIVRPRAGTIVATQLDPSGCIVFEISLRAEGSDTILHGEFYAPGVEIFVFQELDLRPEAGLGKFPRESGYVLMMDFLQAMKNYSTRPL